MITMTIEVSPEQAVLIAEILAKPADTTQCPATPQAPAPIVQTSAPTPAVPAPAPVVPIQPVAPASTPISVQPPITSPVPTNPVTIPTAVKQYTQNELSLASRPIVETGRQQELLDLLHSFTYTDANGTVRNVQSLRDMPKELYPAFANGIRQLGGKI